MNKQPRVLHNTCVSVRENKNIIIIIIKIYYTPVIISPLFLQEGEEFLAREVKRTKTDEDAAAEGEKEAEVSAEA